MISRSGVAISITNCYIRFTYLLYLHSKTWELGEGESREMEAMGRKEKEQGYLGIAYAT